MDVVFGTDTSSDSSDESDDASLFSKEEVPNKTEQNEKRIERNAMRHIMRNPEICQKHLRQYI